MSPPAGRESNHTNTAGECRVMDSADEVIIFIYLYYFARDVADVPPYCRCAGAGMLPGTLDLKTQVYCEIQKDLPADEHTCNTT